MTLFGSQALCYSRDFWESFSIFFWFYHVLINLLITDSLSLTVKYICSVNLSWGRSVYYQYFLKQMSSNHIIIDDGEMFSSSIPAALKLWLWYELYLNSQWACHSWRWNNKNSCTFMISQIRWSSKIIPYQKKEM